MNPINVHAAIVTVFLASNAINANTFDPGNSGASASSGYYAEIGTSDGWATAWTYVNYELTSYTYLKAGNYYVPITNGEPPIDTRDTEGPFYTNTLDEGTLWDASTIDAGWSEMDASSNGVNWSQTAMALVVIN